MQACADVVENLQEEMQHAPIVQKGSSGWQPTILCFVNHLQTDKALKFLE
jgi:predicted sugar kinase